MRKAVDLSCWYLPVETIVDFPRIPSFEDVNITYHQQLWKNKETNEYNKLPFMQM
jgi:hypothetical protein